MRHDIKDNNELAEFLDRPFVIDYLYPIYGEDSVDTLFSGWTYSKKSSWHEFKNSDGDVMEFYPEGTYVIKKCNTENWKYQARTPELISEFIHDMVKNEIPLYY